MVGMITINVLFDCWGEPVIMERKDKNIYFGQNCEYLSLMPHVEKMGRGVLYNQSQFTQFPSAMSAVVVDCCYFKWLITQHFLCSQVTLMVPGCDMTSCL